MNSLNAEGVRMNVFMPKSCFLYEELVIGQDFRAHDGIYIFISAKPAAALSYSENKIINTYRIVQARIFLYP